jgi:hypothetical protein
MQLLQHEDHRFTLTLEGRAPHFTGYVLRFRQPQGEARRPRVGNRYDLPGTYQDSNQAFHAAMDAVHRMINGELRAMVSEVRKRVKEYDLYASALFQLERCAWEPALRIVSRRAANKGATQDFNEEQSPLQRNTTGNKDAARDFALWYGERLVLGAVPGLRI